MDRGQAGAPNVDMDPPLCPQSARHTGQAKRPQGTKLNARNWRIIREADTIRQIFLFGLSRCSIRSAAEPVSGTPLEECGFVAAARLDDVVRNLDVVAVEECAVNAFPD
jgi:hypothetical protein